MALQISQTSQPMGMERTCRLPTGSSSGGGGGGAAAQLAALGDAAAFWVLEALLQLIPWTCVYALHSALPLK